MPVITLTAILMISDVYYPTFHGILALATGVLVGLLIVSLFINFKFFEVIHIIALALIISYVFIVPFFIPQEGSLSIKR